MLDNTLNQSSKFKTKNWIEINNQLSHGRYESGSDIKFKTLMLKSSLREKTITWAGDNAGARQSDEISKGVIFKNCATFIKCISEINNTQVDDAKDLDIVMPTYNVIEYDSNYAQTSESLWPFYRDELNHNLRDSKLFKSKIKTKANSPNEKNTKDSSTIKIFNQFLESSWNAINERWN